MADVFEPSKRSQLMACIRARGNRTTELAMVDLLRSAHITGWRRHVKLHPKLSPADGLPSYGRHVARVSVQPDFLFRRFKLVLFVDGCFWHGCPDHGTRPVQNADYWARKLDNNAKRDGISTRALEAAGWTVVRVWEHELRSGEVVLGVLTKLLQQRASSMPKRPARGRGTV